MKHSPDHEPVRLRAEKALGESLLELRRLLELNALPPKLAALRMLTPPSGDSARVELDVSAGEPGRVDAAASADDWAGVCVREARITYATTGETTPGETTPGETAPVARAVPERTVERGLRIDGSISAAGSELLRALDRTERGPKMHFIALKFFRDTVLPSSGLAWAEDPVVRQQLLSDLIQAGLIVTGKAHNPKAPAFPVTTIRLHHTDERVGALLGIDRSVEFRPITIRGEPISETIIRERR